MGVYNNAKLHSVVLTSQRSKSKKYLKQLAENRVEKSLFSKDKG